ncbi:MAG: carboxy-S-adenosyl-L-methionine synthase CmoA [Arenicella sp.]
MSIRKTDQIYKSPLEKLTDFEFNNQVVSVFEDMINRSVPGYATIVHSMANFARLFAKESSNCYDLGCSLGACALSMRQALEQQKDVTIIGVDCSADMIQRATEFIAQDQHNTPVVLKTADILETPLTNASLVSLNFTLQFIPPEHRQTLIETVYQGMNPGGCLVLSEKIKFPDSDVQEIITELHHSFKADQGYSELEISQKRDALENVMRLDTQQQHMERLKKAGFRTMTQWYQNTSFVSFYAIK